MPTHPAGSYARLGLFVVVGLGCLLATLYLLGRQQNLFRRGLPLLADFHTVSGLLVGNNVRLGGITVGTVKRIRTLNDTTVRVEMSLNHDAQSFVRRSAVAVIGTDGLVGNTIINLSAGPGPPAPLVGAGDVLRTRAPASIEGMLSTLSVSNDNLVGITRDLRQITGKLNQSEALWELLDDRSLPAHARRSLGNVAAASQELAGAARDVRQLTSGIRQGRGPIGYLLQDTAFAGHLGTAARQLAGTSDTLAATLGGLRRQLQTPGGPVHTLLADTTLSGNLRQSLAHVEQGTKSFSQSMEALQHNFLLRGYFRRQQRKAAQKLAAEKQATARATAGPE